MRNGHNCPGQPSAMAQFVECVAEFDGAADDELTIRPGAAAPLCLMQALCRRVQ